MAGREAEEDSTFLRSLDAIVLTGGRGTRLGGVAKAELRVGGARLIDTVLGAAYASGSERLIVVGSRKVAPASLSVLHTREDPPFGGPVAALAAGLSLATAEWVLLLAVDLPRAAELCDLLLQGATARHNATQYPASTLEAATQATPTPTPTLDQTPPAAAQAPSLARGSINQESPTTTETAPEAYIVRDAHGMLQWLAGLYRTEPLQLAIEASLADAGGNPSGLPLRSVVSRLRIAEVLDQTGASADIDTEDDLVSARAYTATNPRSKGEHRE
ncbi:NTP transferase domain-containing protein [Lysinibacter sp. HNR]|uniref:molybdenum cofactor guanylyltransferase n=1 Tax=Lysinibacter sp. HNR TaxID=3031408 RepID=UPI002434F565|nr:NTP transferase domain-containing protein [Lysinibacter sp. HNR]WGD36568.1 NTP transferase domain-containing protein [Lysinibacter sp. HNR]